MGRQVIPSLEPVKQKREKFVSNFTLFCFEVDPVQRVTIEGANVLWRVWKT